MHQHDSMSASIFRATFVIVYSTLRDIFLCASVCLSICVYSEDCTNCQLRRLSQATQRAAAPDPDALGQMYASQTLETHKRKMQILSSIETDQNTLQKHCRNGHNETTSE